MPGYVPVVWNIAKPIEKVILDNEEKSTTYAETGATGLLLGEVSLPAPKNHQTINFVLGISLETKYALAQSYVMVRLWDGTTESDVILHTIPFEWYTFYGSCDMGANVGSSTQNLKGNTQLKLRIYLVGSSGAPTATQYCRNCVLTVVPLYKT